jgi:hypothetical protein
MIQLFKAALFLFPATGEESEKAIASARNWGIAVVSAGNKPFCYFQGG